MKNSTGNPRPLSPVRIAWLSAIGIFGLGLAILLAFPSLRTSVVDLTMPEKPDPEELERRRAQIKKPEPTERQVREIAERVERQKKEELKRKVRELERILEEIETVEENRRELLGLSEIDVFLALIRAIQLKAAEVEQVGELRDRARKLKEEADELSRFTSPEDPDLGTVAAALHANTLRHLEALRVYRDEQASHEIGRRTRAERGIASSLQMADLVARLIRRADVIDPATLPPDLAALTQLQPLDQEALDAMTAPELYQHAQVLDQAIRQEFADVRAAELAAIQPTDLGEALAGVETPQSNAPDLTMELEGDPPTTRAEFLERVAALDQANAAVTAMQLQAESMAAQAQGYTAEGNAQESAQAARLQQALAEAAAGPDGAVIDMTQAMRGLYRMQQGFSGVGDSRVADGTILATGGEGTLMGTASTFQEQRPLQLPPHQIIAQLLPGRKFSRNSDRRGWLYIDTWYVIGPFQRPEGRDLSYQTRFPPEIRVDLDAEYPGKINPDTGRPIPLRWRFFQSNTLKITPPDEIDGAVYYAWTEVFFEEEQDVLVAVASDDAAKVWINDLVVWEDTGLSAWRLDEGFRKVVFRKGFNTVLVRIENGPVVCVFSLLLCPVGLDR